MNNSRPNSHHILFIILDEREFEKWCRVRGNDLLKIEEAELKHAEEEMKDKINAELDCIAKKLNEEAREKRELVSLDANLKTEVRIIMY